MRALSNSHRRKGAILVQVVLALSALAGLLAVILDGGVLLGERRHAQATADAAALAAAADLFANSPTNKGADLGGTARTSALSLASANGYTNDGTISVVTVKVFGDSYTGGPNSGSPIPRGYAE